ncbi:MAG: undecaprenyl-diphosphate phosphatase [Promethearchaeota archaeon]
MSLLADFILAFIQAILEWLPVSSEGFLVLTGVNFFGMTPLEAIRMAIYFHAGTALAVFIKYWRDYWEALTKDRELLRFLIITTAFTGIVGIPIYLLLGKIFTDAAGMILTLLIGVTLLITGTLLRFGKLKATDTLAMQDRTIKDEIFLGFFQGFAILPGISRSGTTVTYLLLRGYKKEAAFKMSFLISFPAVVGAIVFDLLFEEAPVIWGWNYLLIIVFTAAVGYVTMNLLLKAARKLSFDKICYGLGGITILLVAFFYIFG